MISKWLKLVSFHACSINHIQPCLGGGRYKVLVKTLSVNKFLSIKQTPPNLETFPEMHLRTIFLDTLLFT